MYMNERVSRKFNRHIIHQYQVTVATDATQWETGSCRASPHTFVALTTCNHFEDIEGLFEG